MYHQLFIGKANMFIGKANIMNNEFIMSLL